MYSDKKSRERIDVARRLSLSLEMIGFNQGLIQFADSKANGLVVVSSIFLASLSPAIEHMRAAPLAEKVLAGTSAAASVLALLASLRVMLARAPASNDPRPRSLLYHKHILGFTKAQSYVDEFREADAEKVLESFLMSNYDLAAIASAKFAAYKAAERLTLLGALLWIAALVAIAVGP
jgi:hypothetical protein